MHEQTMTAKKEAGLRSQTRKAGVLWWGGPVKAFHSFWRIVVLAVTEGDPFSLSKGGKG